MNRIMSREAGSRFAGKNIVIIGGGTGTSTLLEGFKKYPVNLSVIVTTSDDGGSSGILRKELGVLPPGDIRQCLVALSSNKKLASIFAHRIATGEQKGHAIGNLILANLEKELGSATKAIELVSSFLSVQGSVIPVTLKPTFLSAILENGQVIEGEHNIDQPSKNLESRIKNIELKLNLKANPKAIEVIRQAGVIVFGPGDLYTSTLPNLLAKGIKEAINASLAKKVLVTNIMTKNGQTNGFKVSNFVRETEKYLNGKISYVLANTKVPEKDAINLYKKERSEVVELDTQNVLTKVIAGNFISKTVFKKSKADNLNRSHLRHDSNKLAKIIVNLK